LLGNHDNKWPILQVSTIGNHKIKFIGAMFDREGLIKCVGLGEVDLEMTNSTKLILKLK